MSEMTKCKADKRAIFGARLSQIIAQNILAGNKSTVTAEQSCHFEEQVWLITNLSTKSACLKWITLLSAIPINHYQSDQKQFRNTIMQTGSTDCHILGIHTVDINLWLLNLCNLEKFMQFQL